MTTTSKTLTIWLDRGKPTYADDLAHLQQIFSTNCQSCAAPINVDAEIFLETSVTVCASDDCLSAVKLAASALGSVTDILVR